MFFFLAGDVIDEDNKRARKSRQEAQRLYPALSDLETNSQESDNEDNCCATATVSAHSTGDEMKALTQPLRGGHNHLANEPDDDIEDRCADSFYSCLLFFLCIE